MVVPQSLCMRYCTQAISEAVDATALCLASMKERTTVFYFLELYEIALAPRKWALLEVRSLAFSTQLALEKA